MWSFIPRHRRRSSKTQAPARRATRPRRQKPLGRARRLEYLEQREMLATYAYGFEAQESIFALSGSTVEIPVTMYLAAAPDDPSEQISALSVRIANLSALDMDIDPGSLVDHSQHYSASSTSTSPTAITHTATVDDQSPLPLGKTPLLTFNLKGQAPADGVTENWSLAFQPAGTNFVTLGAAMFPAVLSNLSIAVTGFTPEFRMTGPTSISALPGLTLTIPVTVQLVSPHPLDLTGFQVMVATLTPADASVVSLTNLIGQSLGEVNTPYTSISLALLVGNLSSPIPAGTTPIARFDVEGVVPALGETEFWTFGFMNFLDPLGGVINEVRVSPNRYPVKFGGGGGHAITVTSAIPLDISIDDVTLAEGNEGTNNAAFEVTLSRPHTVPVTLEFVTINGTAEAGVDYQNSIGQLTFAPGQTSRLLVVPVIGDTKPEGNETFYMRIAGASAGKIVKNLGIATITDDDAQPPPPPPPSASPLQVKSLVINDGAAQRSMVTRLAITFSGVATLSSGAFKVTDQLNRQVGLSVASSVVNNQTVVVITFSGSGIVGGSLADGLYKLTIDVTKVRNAAGQALDGDKNGAAGGNYSASFHRLFGDSDGDRDVDLSDLLRFTAALGKQQGQAGYQDYFDLRRDKTVDVLDAFEFLFRVGRKI